MIKAVIFDLDGTLLDTSRDICKTLNESLKRFSLPELSLADTIKYVGNGARKLVERAVGKNADILEEVYIDYIEHFAKCDNNLTKLYPNEAETLKKFREAGIKLCLLTNKPQRATERVYAKFLAEFEFCIVLGHAEYYPLKPDPASTLAILDKLSVKREECIFVGDGETDVETARAAGVVCVSALWGFRTKEQLLNAGAENFAEDFSDLEKFIF